MLSKKFITSILAAAFMIALSASALADTIRLRDGTTIRGQIIAFKDQQFTVLIGAGSGQGVSTVLQNLLVGFFRGLKDADPRNRFRAITLWHTARYGRGRHRRCRRRPERQREHGHERQYVAGR